METRIQTHKAYGLATGLLLIILEVVFLLARVPETSPLHYIAYGVVLIGLILNAQAYSKANGGYITFAQAFSSGFKATAIITLLVVLYTALAPTLFPRIKEDAMAKVIAEFDKNGTTGEARESALRLVDKGFTLMLVIGSLFHWLIAGAIGSLIAAATAPKKKGVPPPQFDSVNP